MTFKITKKINSHLSSLLLAGSLFLGVNSYSQSYSSFFDDGFDSSSKFPPVSLKDVSLESPSLKFDNNIFSRSLERRLIDSNLVKNNSRDKCAVLISGNVERRNLLDLSVGYQVCLENGFDKENIFILDGDGVKTPYYPVDDISSKKVISSLFDKLSHKIDSNDLLFVYIADHGRKIERDDCYDLCLEDSSIAELKLFDENLNDLELKSYLDKIDSRETVVFTNVCYGGGFAERFSKGNYVGISSSAKDGLAHGDKKNTFGRYFFYAYRNTLDSDLNKDGVVSISEAFNYAKSNHPCVLHDGDEPVLKSELDLSSLSLED